MSWLWDHGGLVAEREDEINRHNLYQIDTFCVKVEWHKEYNVRRAFYSFASTNAEN